MRRDYSIDLFKGFLVIGMILVHAMQFFANTKISPISEIIINVGNMITFSGFVFCFGYAVQISYMEKNFKEIYLNLAKNCFVTLIAFYISGIAYRLIIGKAPIETKTIVNVILLNDIPGWSEFLISFAYINIATLILFKLFKKILGSKKIFFITIIILILTCFIPYENIKVNQLGILIGTKNFACFPILQYMPFYILGMYFKKYNVGLNKKVLCISFLLTSITVFQYIITNKIPERFPPSIMWIISPAFILYLYFLISKFCEEYRKILGPVIILGQNVLVALLLSNIFIFTLKSVSKTLVLDIKYCILLDMILLSMILFIVKIVCKSPRYKNKES
ncbi:MAG TPA: acyltransferase family protein [Clostridium sp.]